MTKPFSIHITYKTLNITAYKATISLNEERISEVSEVKMLWTIFGNNKSEIEATQSSL